MIAEEAAVLVSVDDLKKAQSEISEVEPKGLAGTRRYSLPSNCGTPFRSYLGFSTNMVSNRNATRSYAWVSIHKT